MHNPEITHYWGGWSATLPPMDFDLSVGAAPKSMATTCKGLSCVRREIILSCRARNISACSWNVGMPVGSLGLPRHSSDGLQKPDPARSTRGAHVCGGTETRHASAGGTGARPQHGRNRRLRLLHKQPWRNLKPAPYCSTSPFTRGINSKLHWKVVTLSKWFPGFGTHYFHTAFTLLFWFW